MRAHPCALLLILLPVTGCNFSTPKAPTGEAPRWVRTALPEPRTRAEAYALSGTVVPPTGGQPLSFLVAGRVQGVHLREGAVVRPGQILATLEPTTYRAAVEAAAAQTRSARAAAERASDEFKRMKTIYDRQSLAENDFLKYKLAEEVACEQFLQALSNERVARKALADNALRAQAGGVVTRRLVEPGLTVAAGQPAIEISQTDPLEIQVGIPENLVGTLRIGQAAQVTVPAIPDVTFSGTLRVLNATADPASRTYMARIAVANPKGTLRLGMVAEARIQGDRQVPMLLIPYDAVVKDPQGVPTVFEYHPESRRVAARRVVLGALEGRLVEVRTGVDARNPIVIAGQHDLRDGVPVQVDGAPVPAVGRR